MPRAFRHLLFFLFASLAVAGPGSSDTATSVNPDSLHWNTGLIHLPGGKIDIQLPKGFRYLDAKGTKYVLEEVWGNPHGDSTLGMVFGPRQDPFRDTSWGVVLSYEEDGHVDDKDAACIDYEELLKSLRFQAEASNKPRIQSGFAPVKLVGWAERPSYDSRTKKLVWAKELDFGNPDKTLNYSVRILGRTGVLNMNAVARMNALGDVKSGMTALTAATEFTLGNRYADYEPKSDHMAQIGLTALIADVAGSAKTATQIDFFQWITATIPIGKVWLILVGLGLVALIKFWWSRRRAKEDDSQVEADLPDPETSKT